MAFGRFGLGLSAAAQGRGRIQSEVSRVLYYFPERIGSFIRSIALLGTVAVDGAFEQ